jgi:hypothetical protein
MFQKYSERCLLVSGCMGRGKGGAKTQSVTTIMLSKEVFDKATFNKMNICTNNNEH